MQNQDKQIKNFHNILKQFKTNSYMNRARIIYLLILYKIIKLSFTKPIRFKSGIMSPIYCNFREAMGRVNLRELIAMEFVEKFRDSGFDVVSGVAVGAIPIGTLVAKELNLPFSFVRPDGKAKEYGLQNTIECVVPDQVTGKKVLVIEDLVSTGASALEIAKVYLTAGASEVEVACVFTYGMAESKQEFENAGYKFHALFTVSDILPEICKELENNEIQSLNDWVANPRGWFDKYKGTLEFGFLTQLRVSAANNNSIACVGIDPVLEAMPTEFATIEGYCHYIKNVFSEMKRRNILPGMLKFNYGFFEIHDQPMSGNFSGLLSLAEMMKDSNKNLNVPIVIDSKTADIGKSSANYAKFFLDKWGADATTVAPYMGNDSVRPYADYCSDKAKKGAYVLGITSNPGSALFQKKELRYGGMVYDSVIDYVASLAKTNPGIGLVLGATNQELPTVLPRISKSSIAILFPGVGSQGGSARDIVTAMLHSGTERDITRTSSSSAITHPWYKKPGDAIPSANECVDISVNALQNLNDELQVPHNYYLS